jgi:hypothetical protein
LKADSTQGKAQVAKMAALKVGQSMPIPSPCGGLDATEAQAFLKESTDNWWLFECFWHGISFGEATAEVVNNEILFEVL